MQHGKTVAIRQAYLLKVVMLLKPIFFSFGDIKLVLILGGHHLLIHKLQTFGFNGTLLNWFHSYLNNRYKLVLIHGIMSTKLPVRSGVPQGSILGPLMFILYHM